MYRGLSSFSPEQFEFHDSHSFTMSPNRGVRLSSAAGLIAIAIALMTLSNAPAQNPAATPIDADRAAVQKQIADVEKQLKTLNDKLTTLKDQAASPTPVPSMALRPDWIKGFNWRSIGPAAMGGRITAISVFEADPSTFFVATASGGLVKTINNGVSFEHCFDKEATVSIGDVCVAPSDRNIVWVGTGENNPRNSVSYGDGVYKSSDGGKTFKNMGLRKTYQIGKILIHPKDPNSVYVGALGRCYGPNEDRGLYKTTDGGVTWNRILYVDDKTGVLEMRMHPTDSNVLLVATWERKRDEFDAFIGEQPMPDGMDRYDPLVRWGFGTAIHKTTDGGKTFRKITKGLPTCKMGRIGLDWYVKDPNVVFAIIDSEKIGMGPAPTTQPQPVFAGFFGELVEGGMKIVRIMDGSAAEQAGLQEGDIVQTVNEKSAGENESFGDFLQDLGVKPGDKIRVTYLRNDQPSKVEMTVAGRPNFPGFQGPQEQSPKTRPWLRTLGGQGENYQDKQGPDAHEYGGVYKSTDAGESWTRINSLNPRPMYFSQIRVDPSDSNFLYVLGVSLYRSKDGGKTFRADGGRGVHSDHHALWIDRRDGRHMVLGCDGGYYATYDRMQTWDHLNNMALGQFYHVCIDPRRPASVYGGLQDNGSWGGPIQTLTGTGPINEDWIRVGGGDGFVCRVDPEDPDVVYTESQGGSMSRRNLRTGEMASIMPRRPPAPGEAIAGQSGGQPVAAGTSEPVSPRGQRTGGGRRTGQASTPAAKQSNSSTKAQPASKAKNEPATKSSTATPTAAAAAVTPPPTSTAPRGPRGYRFNWNTPFILSNHNPKIVYTVGEFVFRSVNRGNEWKVVSPEVTRSKVGSGTAISESPKNPDVLYVGTDDGALWVTRDGGKNWDDIARNVSLPGPRWVATLEASRFVEGRCYACFDGHRSDDDDPHVYVTENFGKTWKSIRSNLPIGSSRTLREDPVNENLLYVGTEFAAFASIDRGQTWNKINNNLPTVAVHEFAFHPTTAEVVVATHGRSLWVLDVSPLRQVKQPVLAAREHLFVPPPAMRMHNEPGRGGTNRRFVGQNPDMGANIFYALNEPAQNVAIKVIDVAGKTVREFRGQKVPGLHHVNWTLTRSTPAAGPARGTSGPGSGAPATGELAPGRTGEAKAKESKSKDARTKDAKAKDAKAKPAIAKSDAPGEDRPGGRRPRRSGSAGTTGETPASGGSAPTGQRGAGQRQGGGGPGGFGRASFVPPGQYRIVLTVDGRELSQTIRVDYDPALPPSMIPSESPNEDQPN